MSQTIHDEGAFTITPALNPEEVAKIQAFADTRHMRGKAEFDTTSSDDSAPGWAPDQPHPAKPHSFLCAWTVTDDGTQMVLNGACADRDHIEWARYLIGAFFTAGGRAVGQPGFEAFTFDHVVDGVVTIHEEPGYNPHPWYVVVSDNVVTEEQDDPEDDWDDEGDDEGED